MQFGGGLFESRRRTVCSKIDEGEGFAKLLIDILAGRQRLRRQMKPGLSLVTVRADSATRRTGSAEYDWRSGIIRIERVDLVGSAGRALVPRRLEIGAVARRVVGVEEIAVDENRLLDEIARRRSEYRPPFRTVAVEQSRRRPALQHGGELPRQVDRVFEAAVDAIAAVRRMAVRRVACNKRAPGAIAVGDCEAQIPKPDVFEFDVEVCTGCAMHEAAKIEIVAVGIGRHRRMEEPRGAEINAAE